MTVAARTDVGQRRSHNEDRFLVADLGALDTSAPRGDREYTLGPKGAVLLVADGMGGAAAGEVASQMATDLIFDRLVSGWVADSDSSPECFARHVRDSVELSNERIHAQALSQFELQGMGTTVTLVGLLGGNLLVTQVGDSRAYLVRDGVTTQLSRDQSYVQHLIDTGRVTEEQANEMSEQNVILQAVGAAPTVEPVQSWEAARAGDTLVLCSDGLSGQVDAQEIGDVLSSERTLTRGCDRLVDLANERGGPDNITVIVARMSGDGLPSGEEDFGAGL